jgi:restriction system protein
MKNYYRVILGKKNIHVEDSLQGNFIGASFGIEQDLGKLSDDWKTFNQVLIPAFLEKYPEKSKIAAGLACGVLHTIAKEIKEGDVVLCPNGTGRYLIGEVLQGYSYHPLEILPHRRTVRWKSETIERLLMSPPLKNSTGSIGTISDITKYADEIERLIAGKTPVVLVNQNEEIEDPSVFALEKHLEDFLIHNWKQTLLGKDYDIYQEEGQLEGQQFRTDTGFIDILAISKDKKELLVVELKKGRTSDAVLGQIQRYMGYVLEELAEEGQTVRGVIIGLEDDLRIRRSLAVAPNISFYRYQVNFALFKS